MFKPVFTPAGTFTLIVETLAGSCGAQV